MKILLINYRYFLSGGPEKYMFTIKELLESHGHEVIPFSVKSKRNAKSEYEKYFAEPIGGEEQVYYEEYKKTPKTVLQMLDRQFYSFGVRKRLEKLILDTKPDVCYLMHHYNKLSPSVIDACKRHRIPVVMRLSDFFLVCPSSLLVRNGAICEECVEKSLFNAVKHRCVKNSLSGSFIKAIAMYFHRLIKIYSKVNYVVAPSKFTIIKMKSLFDQKKLVHIPTFISEKEKYNHKLGKYLLYAGRIEEEKGIMQAVKAVQGTNYQCIIVGNSSTGYDKVINNYVKKHKIGNVNLLSVKHGKELRQLFMNARCIISPAQWYENMPNMVLEAMMYSKPVIASNLGSLKEIIQENYNGLLFEPKDVDELRKKIKIMFKDDNLCRRLGRNAYHEAITKYSPEKHYQKLITVFNKAILEEKSKWKH
jgi:glycosyltransferase involved in cell wall biosynthesis